MIRAFKGRITPDTDRVFGVDNPTEAIRVLNENIAEYKPRHHGIPYKDNLGFREKLQPYTLTLHPLHSKLISSNEILLNYSNFIAFDNICPEFMGSYRASGAPGSFPFVIIVLQSLTFVVEIWLTKFSSFTVQAG